MNGREIRVDHELEELLKFRDILRAQLQDDRHEPETLAKLWEKLAQAELAIARRS